MSERQYCVYIMTNEHHMVFYNGVTNDLQRRVLEHRGGKSNFYFWAITMCRLYLFLFCSVLLVSCSPNDFDSTRELTQIPAVFYTLTTVPTRTPLPTQILPTPYPTLPLEVQNEFYNLLQANGNCEFPCFLRVIPGETSLGQAKSFFQTYTRDHKILSHEVRGNSLYEWYYSPYFDTKQGDLQIFFHLYIQSSYEKVTGLIVNFQPIMKPDRKSDRNNKLLDRYGIIELFKRHGVPSQIYLAPTRIGQTQSDYILEVIYSEQKILAEYLGFATLAENDRYQMCPAIGDGNVDSFSMAFADPKDFDVNIIEFMHGSFNENFNLETYGKDSLKLLDAEKIYDLFIKQSKRCFQEDEFWLK